MEKNQAEKKKKLLAASIAGLLMVMGFVSGARAVYADVNCSGINGCKGQGACGGKGHSCAGKNSCKGKGYLKVESAQICKEKGGTVLPSATAL